MTRKEKSILLQGLLLFTGLAYLFMRNAKFIYGLGPSAMPILKWAMFLILIGAVIYVFARLILSDNTKEDNVPR